jgi:hypothetical protein
VSGAKRRTPTVVVRAPLSEENQQAVTALTVMIDQWWSGNQGRSAGTDVDRISGAALLRTTDRELVRVCVGVLPIGSRLALELRVCGSDSAKHGPPIAPDLGKRETVVGSVRTTSVICAVSWGNVFSRILR